MIRINIINNTDISESILTYLEDWFDREFGHTGIEWAKPQWYLIMKNNQEIIGRIGIIKRKINVNGKEIDVGGITGVIIKKEFRGKGLSKTMLKKTAEFIKEILKLKFALLLCRDRVVPVYEKCNWYIVHGPTLFEQKNGPQEYSNNTMIINLSNDEWPGGPIQLQGLPW